MDDCSEDSALPSCRPVHTVSVAWWEKSILILYFTGLCETIEAGEESWGEEGANTPLFSHGCPSRRSVYASVDLPSAPAAPSLLRSGIQPGWKKKDMSFLVPRSWPHLRDIRSVCGGSPGGLIGSLSCPLAGIVRSAIESSRLKQPFLCTCKPYPYADTILSYEPFTSVPASHNTKAPCTQSIEWFLDGSQFIHVYSMCLDFGRKPGHMEEM